MKFRSDATGEQPVPPFVEHSRPPHRDPNYPADGNRWGWVAVAGFIATIFAANWALERFGFVSVGFGYMAPAGVYFAGLAFTLRDFTHRTLGRRWVLVAIIVGALASVLVSEQFALASGTAFLVSELADYAVYAPLARKRFVLAVALSNTVGAVVDSMLFLWLAFDSIDFWQGQVIGKSWVTLATVVLILAWRHRARLGVQAA